MGYDIHITRGDWWSKTLPDRITYEEWRRLAEADPEFEVCGHSKYTSDEYDVFCWMPHTRYPTFSYFGGTVRVGHCDGAIFRKMIEVAHQLGAVVQGDEG